MESLKNGLLVTLTFAKMVTSPKTTVVTKTPAPTGSPNPNPVLPCKTPTIILDKSGAPFPSAKNVTP